MATSGQPGCTKVADELQASGTTKVEPAASTCSSCRQVARALVMLVVPCRGGHQRPGRLHQGVDESKASGTTLVDLPASSWRAPVMLAMPRRGGR